jgi:hypothetical protein
VRRTVILFLFGVLLAGVAIGQTPALPSVNLLGAHDVSGRGCLSCHAPVSGNIATNITAEAIPRELEIAPWGTSTVPMYGKTIAFGDEGRYVEVLPDKISTRSREVDGILLCLSCHDGNVTPPSMMVGQSFEQRIGLMPRSVYGNQPIPTLLGNDNTSGGNYANDHPVGTEAVIPSGEGLVWVNDSFTVVPGSPYAQFVSHYGRPSLTPGRFSNPWGVNSSGQPFVLCTTCHNQHVMTVYASSAASQIADDGGGKFYPTFFFVNGPYNPNSTSAANASAASPTQFCRQCHFTDSNEAHNSNTVTTMLPNY